MRKMKKRLIYIRHADDDEKKPKMEHDPLVTEKGVKRCKKKAERLMKKYGEPSAIICSPMYRAKKTAKLLRKYAGLNIPINVEKDVSRFFTGSESKKPEILPVTKNLAPPIGETKEEFENRLKQHVKKMKKVKEEKGKVIWIITHAYIIKKIAEIMGRTVEDHLDYLDSYRM